MIAQAAAPDPNLPIYTALIGLVGVLVGGAVAGVLQFILNRSSFRREKAWALYEQRRTRLENVYEALEKVREAYTYMWGNALHLARGQQPPKWDATPKVPWAHLQMLIRLYVPEILPELDQAEKPRAAVGRTLGQIVNEGSPAKAPILIDQLNRELDVLNSSLDAMRDRIVSEAARLATETTSRTDKWLSPGDDKKKRAAKP